MTTITLSYKAMSNKVSSLGLPRIHPQLMYGFLALGFVLLVVFYTFSINQLTKGVYLIKSYNKQITSLTADNRILQARFASSDFLGNTTQRATELNFEKTGTITYVQMLDNSLAQAERSTH